MNAELPAGGLRPQIRAVIEECTRASDEARTSFPDVVAALAAAGIERYSADLVRGEKTYYLPDGGSQTVPCHRVETAPAGDFSPEGVAAAIRAIQRKEIDYPEFCRRIAEAGCVGYLVSLAGRRAIYSGRTGDSFTEPFPPQ